MPQNSAGTERVRTIQRKCHIEKTVPQFNDANSYNNEVTSCHWKELRYQILLLTATQGVSKRGRATWHALQVLQAIQASFTVIPAFKLNKINQLLYFTHYNCCRTQVVPSTISVLHTCLVVTFHLIFQQVATRESSHSKLQWL